MRYITNLLFVLVLFAASYHGFALEVNSQLKGALLEKQAADPTGTEARIYYNTAEKKAKIYNGTAWSSVGSGGGGINYITQFDAETGITQWQRYDDDSATPVSLNTTAYSSTFIANTTNPLRETKDFKFSITGDQGEGIYTTYTVNYVDVGKVLSIGFEYKTDSSYVDGDLGVYVKSATGGVVKIGDIKKDDTTPYGKFIGYYEVRAYETQTLIIHAQTTGTIALNYDTVTVSPDPFDMVQVVEQINVEANSNGGQVITAASTNITFSTETLDTHGAWNGTIFTAPKTGSYTFTGLVFFTGAANRFVYVQNLTAGTILGYNTALSTDAHAFAVTAKVNFGDQVVVRVTPNGGTLSNTTNHQIRITGHSTSEQVIQSYEAGTEWTSLTAAQVNALSGNNGLGTHTAGSLEYRRDGSDLLIKGKLTVGTVTASEARIPLPAGLVSAATSIIPTIQPAGEWFYGTSSTSHGGAVLIEPSTGYITFSGNGTFSNVTLDPLVKALGNAMMGSGTVIAFNARIPILGWSSQPKLLSLPVSKENVFSSNISSTGTILAQSSDWISSVSKGGTGSYTINFKSGIFTTAPAVVASLTDSVSDNKQKLTVTSVSSSSTTITVFNDVGTMDRGFTVHIQKQGADYTPAGVYVGTVQGDLVSTPNTQNVRHYSTAVATTGTVSKEIGDWINGNCTNADPMVCTLQTTAFPSSTYNCTATTETANAFCNITSYGTSSFNLRCFDHANNVQTTAVVKSVMCSGY